MKGRKGFTLIELLVVIAIIAVLAAILFPVFAKARRAAQNSDCQSNMKQIGSSMKMYLSDWDDTYPTNRATGGTVLNTDVPLTPPGMTNADGTPKRFQYGTNWVEGLYNYVETVSKDGASTWRCQAATAKRWPPTINGANAAITYAFNYNLCEQPEGVIKGASNLMCVRELDRLFNSVLRPTNDSNGNSASIPNSPFLDTMDEGISMPSYQPTNPRQHAAGSNILFADGHVKTIEATSMPDKANLTAAKCWDSDQSQWFNFGPGSNKPPILWRSVAITP